MQKVKYFGYFLSLVLFTVSCGESEPVPEVEPRPDGQEQKQEEPKNERTEAALIVNFGNKEYFIDCIDLGLAGEMNGMEFLKASGLSLIDNNGFTCKIEDVGCEILKCYNCACPDYEDPSCQYWSYWHLQDGKWEFSQVGPEQYTVKPGAVECWMWGNQNTPPKLAGYSCQ